MQEREDFGPIRLTLAPPAVCPQCGTQVIAGALNCPRCHRLIHSEELKELSRKAESAESNGDLAAALRHWRDALLLLPAKSKQHDHVTEKCARLSERLDRTRRGVAADIRTASASSPVKSKALGKVVAGAGVFALLLWKFKSILLVVLTKGKFLLIGLSQSGTVASMALSTGLYGSVWGWSLALGVIASIYVHEMGHVAALQRLGIRASAPMFVPGFGAFVRMKEAPVSPREDARVGLAGPIWGLAAALVAYAVYEFTGSLTWAAIARLGAVINLLNLIPVWQLDGNRGFRAMTAPQRWWAVLAIALTWWLTGEGILILVGAVAAARSFGKSAEKPDNVAWGQYVLLVAALSFLGTLGPASAF